MSILIEQGEGSKRRTEDLIKFIRTSKIGDCHQVGGTFGNRYTHYIFVKSGEDQVKGYHTDRWGSCTKSPSFIASLAGIKYTRDNSNEYSRTDRWHDEFRNFLKMGFISNVSVEYMREHSMITCANRKDPIAIHRNMKLSWHGDLLSRVSAEVKSTGQKVLDNNREVRNRDSRARYHNKRVMALLDKHRHPDVLNGDGQFQRKGNLKDGLVPGTKPMDVFSLINVAYRTELIESFTMEKVLEGIDHDVIDEKVIDERPYELLRFQMPFQHADGGAITATYLKMINPSTGEYCIEGVPNNANGQWRREITMNTVEAALAWRDGDPGSYNVPQALA